MKWSLAQYRGLAFEHLFNYYFLNPETFVCPPLFWTAHTPTTYYRVRNLPDTYRVVTLPITCLVLTNTGASLRTKEVYPPYRSWPGVCLPLKCHSLCDAVALLLRFFWRRPLSTDTLNSPHYYHPPPPATNYQLLTYPRRRTAASHRTNLDVALSTSPSRGLPRLGQSPSLATAASDPVDRICTYLSEDYYYCIYFPYYHLIDICLLERALFCSVLPSNPLSPRLLFSRTPCHTRSIESIALEKQDRPYCYTHGDGPDRPDIISYPS
ncbi:hypothetical protein F5Y01DRAFT_256336 [Xylaria sp. FL0043]|nr:hypothetical protein F5Y01DRAFT_256336 [Xylaria sp. FL0043]